MSDWIVPGAKAWWYFTPPGGYGYEQSIAVTVVQRKKRVQVEAPLRWGGTKKVWVNAEKLKERKP